MALTMMVKTTGTVVMIVKVMRVVRLLWRRQRQRWQWRRRRQPLLPCNLEVGGDAAVVHVAVYVTRCQREADRLIHLIKLAHLK